MLWKIILANYLTALVISLSVLLSAKKFDKKRKFSKVAKIIVFLSFIGATIRTSIEFQTIREKQVTLEEKRTLSPHVDVMLFPFPDEVVTPHKYPLKQYELGIQNLNSNSVPIIDFRIEFIFRNSITEVKKMPLLETGGNLSVWGVEIYEQKKNGSISSYEEQPAETPLTENFSLTILKTKINGKDANTNIAMFMCDRWPERAAFAGKIVIDLSKRPEVVKKPDKIGTYEGIYFYEIKGKKFSEKISGFIPDGKSGKERAKINNNYWLQKLSEVNPKQGTIIYTTSDKRWLEKNNYFVKFIPHITKEDFEIHVYRDKDNIFKVLISNSFSEKVVLKYEDLEKLKSSPSHPKHMVGITWGEGQNKLYIDGVLVDAYPKNNKD